MLVAVVVLDVQEHLTVIFDMKLMGRLDKGDLPPAALPPGIVAESVCIILCHLGLRGSSDGVSR